jgi:hypothetical protein
LEEIMAAREVTVNFFNNTYLTMRRLGEIVHQGESESDAPAEIGSTLPREDPQTGELITPQPSVWKTVSNGFAQGTEASADYQILGIPGTFHMHWNNPFVGSNSYDESAPNGFSLTRNGGSGDSAVVDWVLSGEFSGTPFFKAPVTWDNFSVYFFRGNAYMRYTRVPPNLGVDPEYPLPILGNWKGLGEAFPSGVDAVILWPEGLTPNVPGKQAYFFSGPNYVRYNRDPKNEGVDQGSRPILGNWKGLGEAFPQGVDAAIAWPQGMAGIQKKVAYFFKGNKYVRYIMEPQNEGVDAGYPKPILHNWPGLGEAFPQGIDAAIVWDSATTYFFRGDKYVKYDNAQDKVVDGPHPIVKQFNIN